MVRLGRSSTPLDLMTYSAKDEQPSIFYLKESPRQSILTVFNWTEQPTTHTITLTSLGLAPSAQYEITDVLRSKPIAINAGSIALTNAPHAVYVLKIINRDQPLTPPDIAVDHAASGTAGESLNFTAQHTSGDPVVSYKWDFGDGITLEGAHTKHAWTEPGDYNVSLTATGLSGESKTQTVPVHIAGYMSTVFDPAANQRLK